MRRRRGIDSQNPSVPPAVDPAECRHAEFGIVRGGRDEEVRATDSRREPSGEDSGGRRRARRPGADSRRSTDLPATTPASESPRASEYLEDREGSRVDRTRCWRMRRHVISAFAAIATQTVRRRERRPSLRFQTTLVASLAALRCHRAMLPGFVIEVVGWKNPFHSMKCFFHKCGTAAIGPGRCGVTFFQSESRFGFTGRGPSKKTRRSAPRLREFAEEYPSFCLGSRSWNRTPHCADGSIRCGDMSFPPSFSSPCSG